MKLNHFNVFTAKETKLLKEQETINLYDSWVIETSNRIKTSGILPSSFFIQMQREPAGIAILRPKKNFWGAEVIIHIKDNCIYSLNSKFDDLAKRIAEYTIPFVNRREDNADE